MLQPEQIQQFPLATNPSQSDTQKAARELLEGNGTPWQKLFIDMVEDSYKAITQNNN